MFSPNVTNKIISYFRKLEYMWFNYVVVGLRQQVAPMETLGTLMWLVVLLHFPSPGTTEEVKLGLLIPFKRTDRLGNSFHRGEFYASAMSIAVEHINQRSDLLPGKYVTFIWNDTDCEEEKTLQAIVYQLTQGVSAFIGPGCTCNTSARMASSFNKTMISYVSSLLFYFISFAFF